MESFFVTLTDQNSHTAATSHTPTSFLNTQAIITVFTEHCLMAVGLDSLPLHQIRVSSKFHRDLAKWPFLGGECSTNVETGVHILASASWKIGSSASQKVLRINCGRLNLNVDENIRLTHRMDDKLI